MTSFWGVRNITEVLSIGWDCCSSHLPRALASILKRYGIISIPCDFAHHRRCVSHTVAMLKLEIAQLLITVILFLVGDPERSPSKITIEAYYAKYIGDDTALLYNHVIISYLLY